MPSFMTFLPLWVWVLIAAALIYAGWRWYKYKKSVAYSPNIIRGADTVVSPRDNPPNTGG